MATDPTAIIRHHTRSGVFSLSGGGTAEQYVDLRSALLCDHCGRDLAAWYAGQISDAFNGGTEGAVVGTGAFGAMLLAVLAQDDERCILWNPKGHGVEWSSGYWLPGTGEPVVLVDDVVTTGGTLRALRAACEAQGWRVVGEIVASRASTEDREGGDIEN